MSISYRPEGPWIHADWIGYPTGNSVLQGALAYLDQMQKQGCRAVLNDNRRLVGRWDASLEFLEQQWIPHALSTGLRYWAHLDNPGAFSVESADALRTRINGRFEVGIFEDQLQAEDWLRAGLRKG
ncbi:MULTISPECIES: hypothetical protein [Hymenobacter]|uniref:hypothetical protein n=1 Tax=Hymenobacter TaxID=89966 RepID=UPI00117BC897|nr:MULTISPECIES: hypothetical protein [Hymenobacter]